MRKKEKEVTDIYEIESIISNSDVCRIALADGNIPYIVTMNFGYCGGNNKRIYFHCAPEGRKIDIIRKNNYACFEMDTGHVIRESKSPCNFSMEYKSIVGYGHISLVMDETEKISGLNAIMSHYSGCNKFVYKKSGFDAVQVLRLDITELKGKKS
ncbi:MAG: pyridoxamine 5'-phosphate oxidase family protein [Bacteroidales bacterium]|jgi:hypothetical protein